MSRAMVVMVCLMQFWCAASANENTAVYVYGDAFPPFITENQPHGIEGAAIDLLNQMIGGDLQAEFKVSIAPWKRTYENLKSEPNSIGLAVRRTPQRENQFYWIGPYYRGTVSLYGMKSTKALIDAAVPWRDLPIGVKRGASDYHWLREHSVPTTSLDESESDLQNLKKLILGRVQLVPMLQAEADYYAKKLYLPEGELLPLVTLDCCAEVYIVLSANSNKMFVEKLRSRFEQVKQSSSYPSELLNDTSTCCQ